MIVNNFELTFLGYDAVWTCRWYQLYPEDGGDKVLRNVDNHGFTNQKIAVRHFSIVQTLIRLCYGSSCTALNILNTNKQTNKHNADDGILPRSLFYEAPYLWNLKHLIVCFLKIFQILLKIGLWIILFGINIFEYGKRMNSICEKVSRLRKIVRRAFDSCTRCFTITRLTTDRILTMSLIQTFVVPSADRLTLRTYECPVSLCTLFRSANLLSV